MPARPPTPPAEAVLAPRLARQLLAGPPAPGPLAATRRLLAIQGQDPRGARLAIRARTSGGDVTELERCLSEERSLLTTWLNRGTLHLISSEDYAWLHALTTPPLLTGTWRRLGQEGVSPAAAERGIAAVTRALAEEGPLTRFALRDRVATANVHTEGQALLHILALASLRGLIVRGPMLGRQHAYVLVHDWLGEPPPVDRDRALAELARRYLAGHAPADVRDLAKWSGLPLRDARAGLAAIASELHARADGLVELAGPAPAEALPAPRLLGAFEPVLMGWASRELVLGEHAAQIVTGGIFRAFILVDGRAAGTWSIRNGRIELAAAQPMSPPVATALSEDAAVVAAYLRLTA